MSFARRYRKHGPARVALVAVVLVLVALVGPPLSAKQYLGAGAVLAFAAALTARVAKRRAE